MCLKTRFQQLLRVWFEGDPTRRIARLPAGRCQRIGLHQRRISSSALGHQTGESSARQRPRESRRLWLGKRHPRRNAIADGGLTPAYAPPELFDGRPSLASDQYSLAILYQEMLTGVRPFDGITAAQLAGQHLRERPNLRTLPRADQAVISRALSKSPEGRYPSCTSMIAALSEERSTQQVQHRECGKNFGIRKLPAVRSAKPQIARRS